ncbi:hypothetical protein DFP93_101426 [Aneurinibacillus soli]|uniref:Uncharacterized protein n=1 Tax=Aneurinibacillus soli TaxID=1500254 RepID=A0A0U5AX89_9BACL|nr:DUF2935 domain-containing protein [Aneurinibacillus soli]PYE64397.1 hypothetical protein DFP93_101426 [Aneurinibacillus soli]BAU28346.1 hypothetical protein CB4_02520 [Aneurinibacillus soli]
MSSLFVSRSLADIRFWSRMMKEHAIFLRFGFTIDQMQYAGEADRFRQLFEEIEQKSMAFDEKTEPEKMARFNMEVYHATAHLWTFKRRMLEYVLTGQVVCHHPPLFFDHLAREAAYFMRRLEYLNKGTMEPPGDAIINETIFYLRVMGDHTRLLSIRIDPSERDLLAETADFSYQFDQLLFQAIDMESMRPASQNKAMLESLLSRNQAPIVSLCEFKQNVCNMIEDSQVRHALPLLLADHMLREAEYFRDLLDGFSQNVAEMQPGAPVL